MTFPWPEHLTLEEAAFVQGLRVRYEDHYLWQHHRRFCPQIELPRLLAFMRRNAPPKSEAA